MFRSIEKLYKIFKLEADLNYSDEAVVGGLAKLTETWQGDARGDGVPEGDIQQVADILKGYSDLSIQKRAQAIKQIGQILDNPGIKHLPGAKVLEQPQISKESQNDLSKPTQIPPKVTQTTSRTSLKKPSGSSAPIPANALPDPFLSPTNTVHGIGQKQSQLLSKLGILTVEDLIYFFPRRYDDYTKMKLIKDLTYGDEVTIIACVDRVGTFSARDKNRKIIQAVVSDDTGSIQLMWFNQIYHLRQLRKNMFISISGKIEQYMGRLVMYHPDYEKISQEQINTKRIVPVYPLTARLNQRWLRRVIFSVLENWAPKIPEYLTEYILKDASLMDLPTALKEIHFPENHDTLQKARHRLAFDEIFLLQLGVLQQKHEWINAVGRRFPVGDDWLNDQLNRLPFSLTDAQQKVLSDLRADLDSGRPMNRLLQGDVGSGKTIIAGLGIAMVVRSGSQTAYMAPTSILAEQHYNNLKQLLTTPSDHHPLLEGSQIRLLIGDTPARERQEILEGLAQGWVKLVIGTHALIEDPVVFNDLQFIVVDEQHRFGVSQRAVLREKGNNPHLLVMTATPIPRSLALTVYGDLDLSVLDEMPPGRQPVKTYINYPVERERIYNLVRIQVNRGHQAFIIYPLVEQGENEEVLAAVQEYERLQSEIFPDLRVGLIHGRLRADEKDAIMRRFRDHQFDILVSTTVIEVGVDIPNATIMIIEGADRFGLAQLHQLRGRVGRSAEQSYCFLIPQASDKAENERLLAMVSTHDGFVLAEHDLKQRGPGEFLGTRQSGYAGLRLASLTDVHPIETARNYAQQVYENDPTLQAEEHHLMRQAMEHFWPNKEGDMS